MGRLINIDMVQDSEGRTSVTDMKIDLSVGEVNVWSKVGKSECVPVVRLIKNDR